MQLYIVVFIVQLIVHYKANLYDSFSHGRAYLYVFRNSFRIVNIQGTKILTVSHNSFRMAVVYVHMYFKCKICFTVYTGEIKINDTY